MPTKQKPRPSLSSKEEYERQKKVWYKKLKQSGFEDIESSNSEILKNPSYRYAYPDRRLNFTPDQARIQWAAKQEYYYLANHFLNEHEFESMRERNIWEYHSNGISIRGIVAILNKLPKRKKVNRDTIWKTVKKLSKLMKEKYLKK